ncbi:MAG: hypothetical protein OEZ34_15290 [Spirochaetia bacterium]|nr:hypothetical protein [Spirochaetia bacterium]
MNLEYLVLFGMGLGLMAFLFWMLFPIGNRREKEDKNKIKGYCPICGQGLRKGERIRSSVTEIGDIEVQTIIKGCPFCLEETRKRACPVCKIKLKKDETIIAISDPKVDSKRLSIRGCKKCYPQGF